MEVNDNQDEIKLREKALDSLRRSSTESELREKALHALKHK